MRHLIAVLAAALVACASPAEEPSTTSGALSVSENSDESQVSAEHIADVEALPSFEPPTRARQRLNIDQLSAAIERVSGGLNWTSGNAILWETLAPTLGKPDFVQSTQEDLLPSQLFHKFLDDAARQVCGKMIFGEVHEYVDENHLMVHVSPQDPMSDSEAIDQNLRHLLLAFHGKRFEPGAPELIQWRWLVDSVHAASTEPTEPWNAVCVALITHPRFFSY
jgi:hypothetical protein